jgi:hypothetical protein
MLVSSVSSSSSCGSGPSVSAAAASLSGDINTNSYKLVNYKQLEISHP